MNVTYVCIMSFSLRIVSALAVVLTAPMAAHSSNT